jgi:four helix bundle protein
MFGFQKLDVYRCAVTFLGTAARLAETVPRGYSSLADQLRRAAMSVPLNIAEAGGKSEGDARRHYSIARGSALECAAIVDTFEALRFASPAELAEPRELLERVVSMLTKMTRPASSPQPS